MRKLGFYFLMLFLISPCAHAAYEQYYPKAPHDNSLKVVSRGVANAMALPLETYGTLRREIRFHSRLWPVTYIPRFLNNFVIRIASATHDVLTLPWTAPFAEDTSPWTEGMGLPKYPWNIE